MFDFSWGEVLVIGGVALVVIGPKDLPKALRTVGNMVSQVRRMAGEFQSQFNEAMREAELDEVRKDLQGLNSSVQEATSTAFDPVGSVRDEIKGAIEGTPAPAPAEPAAAPDAGLSAPERPAELAAPDSTPGHDVAPRAAS